MLMELYRYYMRPLGEQKNWKGRLNGAHTLVLNILEMASETKNSLGPGIRNNYTAYRLSKAVDKWYRLDGESWGGPR